MYSFIHMYMYTCINLYIHPSQVYIYIHVRSLHAVCVLYVMYVMHVTHGIYVR